MIPMDRVAMYPELLGPLLPAAWHHTTQYANNHPLTFTELSSTTWEAWSQWICIARSR